MTSEQKGMSGRRPYVFAIVSGKGGVGKTNLAANLAITFSRLGKRVLLFDADLGLANVDVLFGLTAKVTIGQVLAGTHTLSEALLEGPGGITILPASSGLPELAQLSTERMDWLCTEFARLSLGYEVVLIDAPAGIAQNMQRITELAEEVLLLTTPEPTAIMDAYAVTKVFTLRSPAVPLRLIVNMISEQDTGERVSAGFSEAVERFLHREVELLAEIPADAHVALAVRRQRPFVLQYPECQAARAVRQLALRMLKTYPRIPAERRAMEQDAGSIAGRNRITDYLTGEAR